MSDLIYVGKSKNVYRYPENPEVLIMEFKDEVTAGDGAVRATVPYKGILNARTSYYFFKLLEERGIRTHLIDYDGRKKMFVKKLKMVPVEFVARNYAYGSLLKRMPLFKPLQPLEPPIVEFHFKDDSLHDPLILAEDIIQSGALARDKLNEAIEITLKVNEILREEFSSKKLKLIDLKLEFGLDKEGKILLADEITGDSFRVMDESGNHLDKEIFRKTKDANLLFNSYIKLAKALEIGLEDVIQKRDG